VTSAWRGAAPRTDMHLHVERTGRGPSVVLLHADVATGESGWAKQRPLAQRWRLVVPDRPGHGRSAPVDRVDFENERRVLAPLLGDGAHLVGHSYGGVVALLLAAAEPGRVWSLTVIEPPAYAVATDDADVVTTVARLRSLWAGGQDDPEAFFAAFAGIVGERTWPRSPMPIELERGVRRLMSERPPWEAEPDLDALARARIPMMVISGGHSPAFEAVCRAIADRTGARREVIPGARHSVPRTGARFNDLLEKFMASARSGER
jgi:pimeloyl-ACP methyl ester carboxylesterase